MHGFLQHLSLTTHGFLLKKISKINYLQGGKFAECEWRYYMHFQLSIQRCWQFDVGVVLHGDGLGSSTVRRLGAEVGDSEPPRYPLETPENANSNCCGAQPGPLPSVGLQAAPPPPTFSASPPVSSGLHPTSSVGGYYWPINSAFNQPHAFRQVHQGHLNGNLRDSSESVSSIHLISSPGFWPYFWLLSQK